jgi:gliding motility-associated-like protein
VASLTNNELTPSLSVTSNEACIGSEIPQRMPVMTNVTIDKTDATAGQITVKWSQPQNFDSTVFKSPYQYRLFRATGIEATDFAQISVFKKLTDTTFIDKNLNTLQNVYRYKIFFDYTDKNVLVNMGETSPASSVRLTANSSAKQVLLSWLASVPWSNENQTHRIYREVRGKPGVFNKIAEISVQAANSFTYLDNGTDRFVADGNNSITLSTDSSYCYKVETIGTYAKLKNLGLFYNFSQVACASPVDTTRPCSPILTLNPLDCGTLDRKLFCDPTFFKNKLTWNPASTSANGQACRKDISQYKVYFSRYKADKFQAVGSVDKAVLTFSHQRNPQDGFVGCYYVTAINPIGLESSPSNVVCNDNCPLIELPNVFTPNGDGKNDVFAPMNCPAYILQIDFEVYNRDGLKVFESSGTSLAWDGKATNGVELPAGAYFYIAKITFVRLDKTSDPITVKGWVELIR